MLSRGSHAVARGKFLDHFDIGGEAGAREYALQQIVAENGALRDLSGESTLKDIDFVNSLAGIGALVEQILINIRNRERVGIEAVGAGEHALIQRSLVSDGQRGRHARLKNAVTVRHQAAARIKAGPVERVGHLADQPLCRADRQTRIGIERNDITDAVRQRCGAAIDGEKTGIGCAAQQTIEFMQLAALAFPANPFPLACVPQPPAMQKEEWLPAVRGRIARVQICYSRRRFGEKRLVGCAMFRCAVAPVGQQRENKIPVRIGEVENFEPFNLFADFRNTREHCRHRDNRAQIGGNPLLKFQTGQEPRPDPPGDRAVHNANRDVRGRYQTGGGEQQKHAARKSSLRCADQRSPQHDRRDDRDHADIARHAEIRTEAE